jgi:glycine/D-amino acid oxidase-like deaminating enzyme
VSTYWLETADDDPTPREPLDGSEQVDVVIVGAGFTGLWTAWYLRQHDPSLRVLVVEAETAGFGASGRNGAWLTAGIALTPTELARRTSPVTARETITAMRDTVREVVDVCDREGIDAQVRSGGILRVARGPHEVPQLQAGYDAMERLGLEGGLSVLDQGDLADRVRIAGAGGALYDPHGATIHPGRLVRGLARRVEQAGVRIAERTRVSRVEPRRAATGGLGVRVRTDRGDLTAPAVVLACEAWLSQLPGYRRSVLPLYSLVVLTDPIDEDRWTEIGWDSHELLSSHRYTVDYLSRTVDGRVLFGGRGAPYHFGSRIDPSYDHDPATHARLRQQLTGWFPALEGVGFSHAWGGPLGMPRDWCPSFRFDPSTGIGAAYGYTGQGVSTTNLAGRVLADLIATGETPHADLPMVGHRPRSWEPEPLRYVAARYLQGALARIDDRAARTGRPPRGTSLAERLVRH